MDSFTFSCERAMKKDKLEFKSIINKKEHSKKGRKHLTGSIFT